MKTILLTVLIVIFLLELQACCTKEGCVEGISDIELYNFNEPDVDTIIVYIYNKGNTTTPIDSLTTYGQSVTNYYIAATHTLNYEHDYKIYIISTDKEFTLNGFKTSREECNTCFPFGAKDYFTSLKSYMLDGTTKSGSRIQINN